MPSRKSEIQAGEASRRFPRFAGREHGTHASASAASTRHGVRTLQWMRRSGGSRAIRHAPRQPLPIESLIAGGRPTRAESSRRRSLEPFGSPGKMALVSLSRHSARLRQRSQVATMPRGRIRSQDCPTAPALAGCRHSVHSKDQYSAIMPGSHDLSPPHVKGGDCREV